MLVIANFRAFSGSLLLMVMLLSCCEAGRAASKKDAEQGAVLFRDKGCAYCHGVGGVGTKKAPSLTGVYKDKNWTPEKMTDQILNGGQKMPPFSESVTDDEAKLLIAYLRSKNKPVPPPAPEGSATPAPPGTNIP